jgi:hypothetical protein
MKIAALLLTALLTGCATFRRWPTETKAEEIA